MDRGNADDRHGQLHLEDAGIHMAQPFGLIPMALQAQARHEGFITAHDHHDQQVGNHHHVDQAQHHEHDFLLAETGCMGNQVP